MFLGLNLLVDGVSLFMLRKALHVSILHLRCIFKSFSSFPVAAFTLSYNYDEILSQWREKLGLSHIDLRLVTKIVF